jgi:hypothetical protein
VFRLEKGLFDMSQLARRDRGSESAAPRRRRLVINFKLNSKSGFGGWRRRVARVPVCLLASISKSGGNYLIII